MSEGRRIGDEPAVVDEIGRTFEVGHHGDRTSSAVRFARSHPSSRARKAPGGAKASALGRSGQRDQRPKCSPGPCSGECASVPTELLRSSTSIAGGSWVSDEVTGEARTAETSLPRPLRRSQCRNRGSAVCARFTHRRRRERRFHSTEGQAAVESSDAERPRSSPESAAARVGCRQSGRGFPWQLHASSRSRASAASGSSS